MTTSVVIEGPPRSQGRHKQGLQKTGAKMPWPRTEVTVTPTLRRSVVLVPHSTLKPPQRPKYSLEKKRGKNGLFEKKRQFEK